MTGDTPSEMLRTQLRRDLRAAMKAQRSEEMAALRTLIAAVDNAESVEQPAPAAPASGALVAGSLPGLGAADAARRELSERDLQRIIEAELWERDVQAERFELLGRASDASRLRAEATVIARYQVPER